VKLILEFCHLLTGKQNMDDPSEKSRHYGKVAPQPVPMVLGDQCRKALDQTRAVFGENAHNQ
jgi:hypothetical protein